MKRATVLVTSSFLVAAALGLTASPAMAATSTPASVAENAAAVNGPTTQWTIQNETGSTLTQTHIQTDDPYNRILQDWEHGIGHAPSATINSSTSTDLKFADFFFAQEFVEITYVSSDGRSITIRLSDGDLRQPLAVMEANGLTATATGTHGPNSEYTVTIH